MKKKQLTTEQMIDALTKDFLERDGDTFVRIRRTNRLGWEDTMPKDTPYSEKILKPKNVEELYTNAHRLAKDMITAMNTPFKVNVRLSASSSMTNGRDLFVATKVFDDKELSLGKKLDTFTGLAVHEGCHLLYTDFQQIGLCRNSIIRNLQNIIEDERIERRCGEEKPGLANFLCATKYYYFDKYNRELEAAGKLDGLNTATRLINCILGLIRYPKSLRMDDLKEFAEVLLEVRSLLIPYPESTEESRQTAEKIYALIEKYYKDEESGKNAKDRQNRSDADSASSDEQDSGKQSSGGDGKENQEESEGGNSNSKGSDEDSDKESGSREAEDEDEKSDDSDSSEDTETDEPCDEAEDGSSSVEDEEQDEDNGSDLKETEDDQSADKSDDPSADGRNSTEDTDAEDGENVTEPGDGDDEKEPDEEDGEGADDRTPEEIIADALRKLAEDQQQIADMLDEIAQDPQEGLYPSTEDMCRDLRNDSILAAVCEGTAQRGITAGTVLTYTENNQDSYKQSLDRIRKYIPAISKILTCNSTEYRFTLRGMRSGLLDTAKLAEARQGVQNIYIRQGEVRCDRCNVAILIDESGSMSGTKQTAARDTAILLNEAIGRQNNVDLFIYGFTNTRDSNHITIYRDKKTSQRYSLGRTDSYAGTPTGEAILEARDQIRKANKEHCLLFVITDGIPNDRSFNAQAVRTVQKDNMSVVGISIDPNLDESYMKTIYDNYIILSDMSTLAPKLGKVVKQAVLKNTTKRISL